jgi:tetratricopeptide (TPR) repeat protein
VLDQLDTGDQETSARAVFSWSYQHLSEQAKRLFRLLGVHPGPDTGAVAAASLSAVPIARAHAALRELSRAHLAEEHRPGRFALHDLLRAYAAELAAEVDGAGSVRAAELRLLDHYLHTGHAAAMLLAPSRDCGALAPPAPGVLTEPPGTADAAMAWFTAESRPLLAACSRAAERGLAAHGWQLPWAIAPYLISQGRWIDFAATQRTAVDAAERAGDLRGLGHAHHHLGYALDLAGDGHAAESHLRRALDAFTQAADDPGRGLALHGLAQVLQGQGRPDEALPVAVEALRLRAAIGPLAAAASSENSLGAICVQLGRYTDAIEHYEQALRLCDEAGTDGYRGEALHNLGVAHLQAGEHAEAVRCLGQAVDIFRETDEMPYLAAAFTYLARAHRAAGNPAAAQGDSATARAILDGMPPPDAERVRAWIERV